MLQGIGVSIGNPKEPGLKADSWKIRRRITRSSFFAAKAWFEHTWWVSTIAAFCLYLFICTPLADLPELLASNVDSASWRGAAFPEDVVCLVKRYICSSVLNQPPLLVLPQSRISAVSLIPQPKIPVCNPYYNVNVCITYLYTFSGSPFGMRHDHVF